MFSTKELRFIPIESPPPPPTDWKSVKFGCTFAPYMLSAEWDEDKGWSPPVIGEVQPVSLHPAALVFHFAVETMETLKAFRGYDDRIRMFRYTRLTLFIIRLQRYHAPCIATLLSLMIACLFVRGESIIDE